MKEPLRTIVYRQLLEMIVSCKLAPGSFVNEDMLMEITGTSRTPVREAVQRLEEDRFVMVFPKRGIYVCELSTKGLREIFEIRRLIEPFIIRQYGMRIPRDDTAR
ncbi:MAG: GntR family transcriptional regulator, partial [Oscillospiraceae bacterium]|nr:GntR family transcriptional regulator [Oscillospiraceae bacterium]